MEDGSNSTTMIKQFFSEKLPVIRQILAENAGVPVGFKELDRLEKERAFLQEPPSFNKRSRIHATADIMQALPRFLREPLARTLGITPQGAGYLISQMRELTARRHGFAG
jgi:hypothetical protein